MRGKLACSVILTLLRILENIVFGLMLWGLKWNYGVHHFEQEALWNIIANLGCMICYGCYTVIQCNFSGHSSVGFYDVDAKIDENCQ